MRKKRGCGIGCLTIFIIIVVLGIIGSLVSPDNNQQDESIKYKIGDTVKTENVEFTVLDVENKKTVYTDDSGLLSYEAEGNNIFFTVYFRVKNISNSSISIDNSGFIVYDDDVQYSPSTLFTDDAMNIDALNPGTEVEGKLYYSIPEDSNFDNLKLISNDNIFSEAGDMEIELK